MRIPLEPSMLLLGAVLTNFSLNISDKYCCFRSVCTLESFCISIRSKSTNGVVPIVSSFFVPPLDSTSPVRLSLEVDDGRCTFCLYKANMTTMRYL